jgi:ferredoxin
MAKIILDNQEREIGNGDHIKPKCKEMGIEFGCENGICSTCLITVKEGMENLSERTQAEEDMGLEDNMRLACQCRLMKGTVKIAKHF